MGGIIYQGKSLVNTKKTDWDVWLPHSPCSKWPELSLGQPISYKVWILWAKKNRHHICLCPQNPPWVTANITIATAARVAPVAPVASILLIPLPMIDLFLRMTELAETWRDKEQRQAGVSITQTKLGTSGILHVSRTLELELLPAFPNVLCRSA